MNNKVNSKIKGYIYGAVAAATYGLNPAFALPLYADGITADCMLFYRYAFAIPIMAIMIAARGRSFKLNKKDILPVLICGILMALSSLCLFESYTYMDAGIASTLLFVYPLMVAIIMWLFFKEKMTGITLGCIVTALVGIALLFKGGDKTLSVTGTIIVMASALFYAIYIVGVNRPGLREVPTVKLIFYVLIIGALFFGIKISVTPGSHFQLPSHWYLWGYVLALAVLPTVVSFICTTAAIQHIGPTPTAILGALEPATAVLIGVTIFHEMMTPRDYIGLILIIVAVSVVVAGGKITSYLVRFRRLFPNLRKSRKKHIINRR